MLGRSSGSSEVNPEVVAMPYEIKAEYEFRAVLAWHIVPAGGSRALCGRPLAPASATRPISDMGVVGHRCQPCEAIHSLRNVLPDQAADHS
jgi:hypothetical protein